MKAFFAAALSIGLLGLPLFTGCKDRSPPKISSFVGQPPHGGTAVALNDDYNLELVLDASTGTLSAYVLDDDMEEFIRSTSPSFEIEATVDGAPKTLVLQPKANPATGETVGNSSYFEVQADWLKTTKSFDGILNGLAIRGTKFNGIKFNFPKGTETGN